MNYRVLLFFCMANLLTINTNLNILDLQQAAWLLQMSSESLRLLAFRGAIPAQKPGRKWLFVEKY